MNALNAHCLPEHGEVQHAPARLRLLWVCRNPVCPFEDFIHVLLVIDVPASWSAGVRSGRLPVVGHSRLVSGWLV